MLFDENAFQVLLPLKNAWSDSQITTPCNFASHSLLERAFSELLFCADMHVETRVVGQLSQPFTSLPAVRECPSLVLGVPPIPLTVVDVIEWLNADASSKEPKYLQLLGGLEDSVEDLINEVKTVSVMLGRKARFSRTESGFA